MSFAPALDHLGSSQLDSLQYIHAFLELGSSKLDMVLQIVVSCDEEGKRVSLNKAKSRSEVSHILMTCIRNSHISLIS